MGKPHPIEVRERVVAFVEQGHSHRLSKLKTLLRKLAARTYDEITDALGQICELYSINECRNYFKAAGYEAD